MYFSTKGGGGATNQNTTLGPEPLAPPPPIDFGPIAYW